MARVASLHSLFLVLCSVFMRLASAELREPPKISEEVIAIHKAVVGRTVKLRCPVTGNPPPLTMWQKDGVTINRGWDRFRLKPEGLKISRVVIEDTGTYVCRATNGFGSISLSFNLTVTEEAIVEAAAPSINSPEITTTGTMPQFTEPSKMLKTKKIMQPLNSSVRLKCKASGHPRPEIVWEKDGIRMVIPEGKMGKQFTLKLSNLKPDDSGFYTCIVYNKHGGINATYELDVVDKVKRKPDLLGEHPVNTTVAYGGSASFQCRVRSEIKPHIQWLKRVETSRGATPTSNATITMRNQTYVVLPAGDVLRRGDDSYLNKIVIGYATADDAGMYICLGANSMGYSFKSAFLQVLPDPNLAVPTLHQTPHSRPVEQQGWSQTEKGLLIGVPLGLALLFIVAIIACTVSRNKAQQRHRNAATPPPQPHPPNHTVKKDYGLHRDYLHRSNLSQPQSVDLEQCAPLTAAQCAPVVSQQTLHIYPMASRENVLNRYDVHSPSSFTDTLNSNGSLTSSSHPNMHHHLHQHTILHC